MVMSNRTPKVKLSIVVYYIFIKMYKWETEKHLTMSFEQALNCFDINAESMTLSIHEMGIVPEPLYIDINRIYRKWTMQLLFLCDVTISL